LVVVSGDVFESSNPPIEAEELYFDALARLGDGGRRAVVVIAGNHDSPDRLRACAPLSRQHGVWIFGRPLAPAAPGAQAEPCVLKLDLPCGERVILGAVPYPSEARLGEVLSESLEDEVRQRAYSERLRGLFASIAEQFEPGAVNLLTSHLAVRSCMPSTSERALIGGAWQVDGDVFPAAADYVALGHLHLAQAVPDAAPVTRYAGSPLALRFSERDYARSHVLVDLRAGRRPAVELVPVRAGRPLVVWQAGSVEEVEHGVASGLHSGAWIDLELHLAARPTHAELLRIRALQRTWARTRVVLPEAAVGPHEGPVHRRDWPLSELFAAFYREQTGREPAPALTELFLNLVEEPAPPAREGG
jgi:DNA repair protein SbcD/Mre11